MWHCIFSVDVRVRIPCLALASGFEKCVQCTRGIVHAFHSKTFSFAKLQFCFFPFLYPHFFLSEWTFQLTQEYTAHFSLSYWEVFWGKSQSLSYTQCCFKMEHTNSYVSFIHSRKISKRLQLPIDYSPLESGQGGGSCTPETI